MTEQQPRIRQTKAELQAANEALQQQLADVNSGSSTEPRRITLEVSAKDVGRTVRRVLPYVGWAAAGALAIAALNGGNFNGQHTGEVGATPAPAGATSSPEPSPTNASETSTNPDTFVARATDTEHGWNRATLDLTDVGGPKIDVDRLDYQPSSDPSNPNKVTLMAGAVIDGDTNINGVWSTDSNAQTGSEIYIQQEGAAVDSKWGFTVYENFDPKYTDLVMQIVAKDQESTGCGLKDGCKVTIAQVYTADGKLTPYDAQASSPQASAQPSQSPEATHPADCQCAICCQVVAPTCAPTAPAQPSAQPSQSPEAASCTDGYDHQLDNIYHGDLTALKKDVANGKNTDYLVTVNPGEQVIVQGDDEVLANGKLIKEFDNSSATGGVTYISVPEGRESVTVYMIYGGDVHKLASCTTQEEAQQLVQTYIQGMEKPNGPYNTGNVTEYDVK